MKKCSKLERIIPAFVFVGVILLSCRQAFGSGAGGHINLLAGRFMYNNRQGYFDFGQLRQDTALSSLPMWGGTVARRYPLASWVRVQLGVTASFGGVDKDTTADVPLLVDGGAERHEVAWKDGFFHVGIVPELHYVFPPEQRFVPCLRAGTGLHYMRMTETLRTIDEDTPRYVDVEGAMEGSRVGASIETGLGVDVVISEQWSVNIGYSYRYWHPVGYEYTRDLPRDGVDYWESFRSHILTLGILWGRPSR